jgi:thioredoxin-like negative regulator of GroEL
MIAPHLHKECKAHNIPLAKVNVDVNVDAATHFSITAMPTLKILNEKGEGVFEVVGGGQPGVNKIIAEFNKLKK